MGDAQAIQVEAPLVEATAIPLATGTDRRGDDLLRNIAAAKMGISQDKFIEQLFGNPF